MTEFCFTTSHFDVFEGALRHSKKQFSWTALLIALKSLVSRVGSRHPAPTLTPFNLHSGRITLKSPSKFCSRFVSCNSKALPNCYLLSLIFTIYFSSSPLISPSFPVLTGLKRIYGQMKKYATLIRAKNLELGNTHSPVVC